MEDGNIRKDEGEESAAKTVAIQNSAELKDFLLSIRDKLADRSAAPIITLSAMNHIMNLPGITELLDKECKELARDIWLRLKQAGIHVKNPPLLFGDEVSGA